MSRSTVMDADASPEEAAQYQNQMQEDHDNREEFNAYIAGRTGQGDPNDPFDGTSAAWARARRHTRAAYAKEDFEPEPLDPIDDHVGPRSGDEVRDLDELRSYAQYRMALAREKHPDFNEIVFGYVISKLEEAGIDENHPDLQQWLLTDPNFAEEAYRYGLMLKNKERNKLPEGFKNWSVDEFTDWLEARQNGGDRAEESPEFTSKRELRRLNRLSLRDFEKALDAEKYR